MKNRVKLERTVQGIAQQALASQMGVSRQTIHAIETGKYVPSTVLALKLSSLLKKPVEELFELDSTDWSNFK
jgi:putative transcriptional regulator